ncbi:acylphosphatase [Loigolactobacillus rennini]|nr:acylphosphatase [Loigolactobacillus rennini]
MRRISMTVFGRVQGVGFRYTTKMIADRICVKGLVRNLFDGSVYIEALGSNQQIDAFIKAIKKGPSSFAKINRIDINDLKLDQDYRDFAVTY